MEARLESDILSIDRDRWAKTRRSLDIASRDYDYLDTNVQRLFILILAWSVVPAVVVAGA